MGVVKNGRFYILYLDYNYYAAALQAALRVLPVILSVRPSVCPARARNSQINKRRKSKISTDVPHGTCKWSASFQFERSNVKVTGSKTSKICHHVYLPADQVRQVLTASLHARPTPLLGLLYCRRLRP